MFVCVDRQKITFITCSDEARTHATVGISRHKMPRSNKIRIQYLSVFVW